MRKRIWRRKERKRRRSNLCMCIPGTIVEVLAKHV
jgi:hypothetical protein